MVNNAIQKVNSSKSKSKEQLSLEADISRYIGEITCSNADLSPHISSFKFDSADKYKLPDGSIGVVVFFPVPVLKAIQKLLPRIQNRVTGELEKRLSGSHVLFVAKRRILKKPTRKFRLKQMRPRSRTLTSVHENILNDLVYPTEIVGKRTHIGLKKAHIKVYLDRKDKSAMEGKIDCISYVYKKLTGKDVEFLFSSPVIGG